MGKQTSQTKTNQKMLSCVLNLYRDVRLYKNHRHHVNPKRQGVTCVAPTPENGKPTTLTPRLKQKKERRKVQKLEIKQKLKTISYGNEEIDKKSTYQSKFIALNYF